MGITQISLHIYGEIPVDTCGLEFRSFSEGWQTCTTDLWEKRGIELIKAVKLLSKKTSAPVLIFEIIDSDSIYFDFYQGGKSIAAYTDHMEISKKNIYSVPTMIGYGEGNKKRLSNILSCRDAEEKLFMLEEFFGVCLAPPLELIGEPEILARQRGDEHYRRFMEQENMLKGKNAPISAKLVAEYKGKIFLDLFGQAEKTQKKHCYLFGYREEADDLKHELIPVRFSGDRLEPITKEEFYSDREKTSYKCELCDYEHGARSRAVFNQNAPVDFVGKSMILPEGYFVSGFDAENRLVLDGGNGICIVDKMLKIIAKIAIKGDVADMIGNYLLTATGDSFCGYCYEPRATVRIYELVEQNK